MKILAVDTATTSCSVAIVDNKSILAEITIDMNQTHSKYLMRMIEEVLDLSGFTVSNLDGIAVSLGPGSFTGLRIGISAVKGLVMASQKPVVGISTLDALAFQFSYFPGLICTLLDARKGEVYCSRYRFQEGVLIKEMKEQLVSPVQAVSDICEPCLFVGKGAWLYKNVIMEKVGKYPRFAPAGSDTIRSSMIAWLSMERFEKYQTDNVLSLIPNYIRTSDAELNLGKRTSSVPV